MEVRTHPAHLHFHTVASYSGLAALRVITINHHTAGLAGLQHLSIDADAVGQLHQSLSNRGVECVVLRTCNRSELYWRARASADDETATVAFAGTLKLQVEALQGVATLLTGEAVGAHLFRVCAGLESAVLGEAEVLGQVRTALDACADCGTFLDGLFRAALRTGRQARAETAIGAGAMSVASTAVQWIGQRVPIARSRVLIIGAGETGTAVARHLRSLGVDALVIANRTVAHAEALAATVGARATGLDGLSAELARANAVICAAGVSQPLVTLETLRAAVASSPSLVVADVAMPSGIEAGSVEGVTRIDLEGLEQLAELCRQQRAAEVPKVEAIIARELQWLMAWARHEALRPLVSGLRRKVEAIRRAELVRATEELDDAGQAGAAVLERLSRRLLDQVLAIPLAQLENGELPLDAAHAEYLRRLFALADDAATVES